MMKLETFGRRNKNFPSLIDKRLGDAAPRWLFALGNMELLKSPKNALFCSIRTPGKVILVAYDLAARWRDEGRCVISGFHSPIEKECLKILLRGRQPIIICPARGLAGFRMPSAWKKPLVDGRLLIISRFSPAVRRTNRQQSDARNRFVAALADKIVFAHIAPGGSLESLKESTSGWRMPCSVLDVSK